MFNKIVKVGGMTIISRILGLVRDTLNATVLGASIYSDAFFIAFKFPNVFRALFAEGSLNAIFTPIFTGLIHKHGKAEAKRFANEVFSILFYVLMVLIIIIEIFMPEVVLVIAPGFKNKSLEAYNIAVALTRICLPYLFFISISTLYSAILNSLKKFTIAAILPIILNVCLIIAFLIDRQIDNNILNAYIVSYAVTFAGIFQLLFIWWYAKKQGWVVALVSIKKISKSSKLFFKKVIPVVITAGFYQINVFIDITIASWLVSGAITYLYYGDRLVQLPLAIIGIATSTVIVPFIVGKLKNDQESNQLKSDAMLYGVVLGFPAVLAFIILGHEIVSMLFQHGKFSSYSVDQTYYVLCAYVIGLIPNILIKIIVAIFYAESDSNTPFFVNVIILLVNTIFAVIFAHYLGYIGIALATSISSIISVVILAYLLIKRKLYYFDFALIKEIVKSIIAISLLFIVVMVIKKIIVIELVAHNIIIDKYYNISFILLMIATFIAYIFTLKIIKSKLYLEMVMMIKKEKR
ncbi:murein biosynthesis integral membrane protein MurJ [Rickettsiales bacterium LUAb2]